MWPFTLLRCVRGSENKCYTTLSAGLELKNYLDDLVNVFGSPEKVSEQAINANSVSEFAKAVSDKRKEKK